MPLGSSIKVLARRARGALLGQGILRSPGVFSLPVDLRRRRSKRSSRPGCTGHPLDGTRSPGERPTLAWDSIETLLARERPDAVLVGTDVELHVHAAHREDLERRFATHVVVSSPRVVAIADDKYLTFRFLKDNGFDAPESALPEDEAALAHLIEGVGFPLVVKPRVGARSVGVSVVGTLDALARALEGAPRSRRAGVRGDCR